MTAETIYDGDLRCTSVHIKSGSKIISDAPIDNRGKGAAFSPTDLVSVALTTCILTVMGIAARDRGINMDGAKASVQKVMASGPRRISRLAVEVTMPAQKYTEEEKTLLYKIAVECPVAKSIHPDIDQEINFIWT